MIGEVCWIVYPWYSTNKHCIGRQEMAVKAFVQHQVYHLMLCRYDIKDNENNPTLTRILIDWKVLMEC